MTTIDSDVDGPSTMPQPLGPDEVRQRVKAGRVNTASTKASRSVASILRSNILTRFNAIISALLVVVLVFGHPADALFGLVMVINALIGIVQELRAKRTLDRLTVLIAPRATVHRSSGLEDIPATGVVIDDVIVLGRGQQVPVDADVMLSEGLEVSESLLTGESVPVAKAAGDSVFSGSFVVAGSAECVVTAVGDDAYAQRLAREAKKFTLARSELAHAIDQILRIITWLLLPTSALLLWSQLQTGRPVAEAAVSTVAGVVAMVPQGLVLLVSMAFAVAVIRLGERNVLVQEIPAVETLARVDLLCVDKTGTLTDGSIALDAVEVLYGTPDVGQVLGMIAASDPDPNPTMVAIAESYPWSKPVTVTARMSFSSDRKASAVSFDDGSAWVVGAAEFVVSEDEVLDEKVAALASTGRRVLVVARTDGASVAAGLIENPLPVLLLSFAERIRPDAGDTVAYFQEQGVALKVISGDSPVTVSAVARSVGIPNERAVDARQLPTNADELSTLAAETDVFGRVTPEAKRDLVGAFHSAGHVVAMTGDGVNDVLAVKDADLGIAMGAGSGATRAVSQLVLLDNAFSALPHVVAEGRRVVANMERVSALFLTKTVYATLLAVLIGFVGLAFPFLPRHLTLIGALTIGIPAFFMSFEPRERPIRPGFIPRVFAFAIPAGLVTGLATFTLYGVSRIDSLNLSLEQSQTAATTMMIALGLVVLYELIEPPDAVHLFMIGALFAAYLFVLAVPPFRELFGLLVPQWQAWVVIGISALVAGVAVKFSVQWARQFVASRYGIDPA